MLLTRPRVLHKNTLYMTVKKRGKTVDVAGVGPLIEKTFLKTIYSAPERCKKRCYL